MKRIVILGAAESGVGAAILAQQKGYEVFVSDMGNIKERYKTLLDTHDIPWEEGHHTAALILSATEVIKSPGIPEDAPMVVQVRDKGIPVISDIEFAARYTKAQMLCITGSNGKTTTTSLLYHILRHAGFNVGLAGNIGRSFALQVAEENFDYYVLELSSFQLDDMIDFRAHVAILLNITPDHLDRYDYQMQRYTDAKMRITRNQCATDAFIYWQGDPIIAQELHRYDLKSNNLPFADHPHEGDTLAAYIAQEHLCLPYAPNDYSLPVQDIALQGLHNLRNVMAAAIAARFVGVPGQVLSEALQTFTGVEHRLEYVRTVNGVRYINDSKATNVDACYCALESMTTPTILIVGGKDKGNDYTAIAPLVQQKCKALVLLGADNQKLIDFFTPLGVPMTDTHSMAQCMRACTAQALPGDTVLLSPCCASFDLFRNMEDRGDQFKTLVQALPT